MSSAISKDINVKKGLSLKLKGEAEKYILESKRAKKYIIKPTDFHKVIIKLDVKEGDDVKAGEKLFYAKNDERILFVSPVNGKVEKIVRGQKRKILAIVIAPADKDTPIKHSIEKDITKYSKETIKALLLSAGCWPMFKQRPYDVLANPDDNPKGIFISCFSTAPLTASLSFVLKNDKNAFQKGINVLNILSPNVNISLDKYSNSYLKDLNNVNKYKFSGRHPTGNVSVLIDRASPMNQGERAWVINPQDVALIGKLFTNGYLDFTKIIALTGPQLKKPHYLKIIQAASLDDVLEENPKNTRYISGDVFSGVRVERTSSLGYYHNTLTLLPEGDKYRLMGWVPFFNNKIPSFYNTSFFKLFKKREVVVNTNLNGEERAIVVTGKMEKIIPLDIYPLQLIKACLVGNIEKMEELGIYEIAPEDFGLADYISTSKIETQQIIREALDLMLEEVG